VTASFATQIELDDRGVAWIAGTKVNLWLAQIHGAFTYYYENQGGIDEQIRRGLEESGELAVRLSGAEFRRKLLDLKRPR